MKNQLLTFAKNRLILFSLFFFSISLAFANNASNNKSVCEIWDVVAIAQTCDENDLFLVDINFNYDGIGDLGFKITGNGNNYGEFSYADVPVTIGPFEGNCTTNYEFVITDLQLPDCSAFDELGTVCCGGDCSISEISVETLDCTGDNQYAIIVDFTYSNVNNAGFDVFTVNDVFLGYFLYENLPITITDFPASGNDFDWLLICNNDSETCCEDINFPALDCSISGDCNIYDMVAEVYTCDSNDMFFVDINFQYENVGDQGFMVLGNGTNYGTFSYDSLYITLGPFAGDCTTDWEFLAKDVQFEGCSDFVEVGHICCNSDCEIFEINVDAGACTGENTYNLWLNFGYNNVNGSGFDVYGPGNVYVGYYLYADLPITIQDFPGSGNNNDVITVCDSDSETCCKSKEFNAPECPGESCNIYDLVVEAHECDSSNLFFVDIDFNYSNVGENGFMILGNGNNYGTFSYDSLFITLGPLEGGCDNFYEFIIKDVDHPDCTAAYEFGTACCAGECEIFEMNVDPVECTGTGTYDLWLNFGYSNVNSASFDVYGPGNVLIGTYLYADLPVLIEDYPSSGNDYDWLKVCDHETEGCCKVKEFEALDCGTNDCNIYDLVVEAYECNDLNQFYVDIDFNYSNVGENGFMILGNGNNYGTFSYDSLYITLGPLEGGCDFEYEFIIKDVDYPDCTAAFELGTACCEEECEIFEINVDPGACTGENTYNLYLNFGYNNVNGVGFDVYGPGSVYVGYYLYADLPIIIQDFPGSGNNNDVITVCDSDSETCCKSKEFNAPECPGESCSIYDLVVEASECDSLDQFYAVIDFNYANVGDNGFTITLFGDSYGPFSYDDLPVTLGPFEADCTTHFEFKIKDVDNPDCSSDEFDLGTVCCEAECEIFEMNVEPSECSGPGTYDLWLNFGYANVNSASFDVYGPGNVLIGTYLYADLPVLIEDYPSTGNNFDWIKVCDHEAEGCCKVKEFEALECGTGECHIYDLVVEAHDCDSSNMFFVDIDFNYSYVGNNGFTVTRAGEVFGPFSYEDLYITIGPFEGDCTSNYEFNIHDVDNPQCNAEYDLGKICCEAECEIFEMNVDPLECTGPGTYDLWLNFGYANVNSASFDVYGPGNVLIGTYLYADLPVLIEDYPSSGNNFDWIKVCDHETEGCCKVKEFEALECGMGECAITDLAVQTIECTGIDQYAILLDFNYSNVNGSGFDLYGPNNQYIGYYLYSSLPLLITDFPGSGNNNDWLKVCDSDSESCCEDIEFEALNCSDEDCILYNLMIDPGECTSDSTYSLFVNFDYQNTSSLGFDLAANGSYFGFYTYDQLPLVINNFPKSGFMYDWIAICDNDNLECCTGTEFMTLECTTATHEIPWEKVINMYSIADQLQVIDLSDFARSEELRLDLFNIDGKRILSKSIMPNEQTVDIDITNFAASMYIVRLQYGDNIFAKQFVKISN